MILRDGTQDMTMLKEVYFDNEYRLPERFQKYSTVVDIGAHIGIFALACWERGAEQIKCYEPEPDNYDTLRKNIGDRPEIWAFKSQVWRSDCEENVRIFCPGPAASAQTRILPASLGIGEVTCNVTYSLDEIILRLGKVDLLKIDCEGAEYPILFTSKTIRLVKQIVGETHELYDWPGSPYQCGSAGIREFLEKQGFSVEIVPHPGSPEVNHLFFAKRL